MNYAQRPKWKIPAAIWAAERKESNFIELKGFSTFLAMQFLPDGGSLRHRMDDTFLYRIKKQHLLAGGVVDLDVPDGEINYREVAAGMSLKDDFRGNIFILIEKTGQTIPFLLDLSQRNIQGKKAVPHLQVLRLECPETDGLDPQSQGGEVDFQIGIGGHRVVQYASKENLRPIRRRRKPGFLPFDKKRGPFLHGF